MITPRLAAICRRLLEIILLLAAGTTALAAWIPRVLGQRTAPVARHKGTSPTPPRTLGIVLAEPDLGNVSLQGVANLACWAADLGIQYVYLYDPAGHLRRSQAVLQNILAVQSEQHGITVTCQVGWSGLQEQQPEAAMPERRQAEAAKQQHQQLQQEHEEPQQLPLHNSQQQLQQLRLQGNQQQPQQRQMQGKQERQQLLLQQQQQQQKQQQQQQQAMLGEQQRQKKKLHTKQPASTNDQLPAGGPATSTPHHITVHVLGPGDSWAPLLAVARQLPQQLRGGSPRHCARAQATANGISCEAKQKGAAYQTAPAVGRMDPSSPSPSKPDVYAEMAELAGPAILREPQLLLVYGPVLTLAGYPPFHTRSCEIYHMGPMCSANRQQLAATLALYCRVTLQRHGT